MEISFSPASMATSDESMSSAEIKGVGGVQERVCGCVGVCAYMCALGASAAHSRVHMKHDLRLESFGFHHLN